MKTITADIKDFVVQLGWEESLLQLLINEPLQNGTLKEFYAGRLNELTPVSLDLVSEAEIQEHRWEGSTSSAGIKEVQKYSRGRK